MLDGAASRDDLKGFNSDINADTTVVFINCESGSYEVECLTGRVREGDDIF